MAAPPTPIVAQPPEPASRARGFPTPSPRAAALGEGAILFRWPTGLSPGTNQRIQELADRLNQPGDSESRALRALAGIDSLLVEFDPLRFTEDAVVEHVRWAAWSAGRGQRPRRITVPVSYGKKHGPDLDAVAERVGLTPATVVRLHAGRPYHIYCLGFQAGFPYAGPLAPVLVLPRRGTPRVKVPPGAVAIAGAQTGIYPRSGPGGWHVIGSTPLALFDPGRSPPTPYGPGDELWFEPIDDREFERLAGRRA
jgi:KipI family sensor histidine kinase inhibitor